MLAIPKCSKCGSVSLMKLYSIRMTPGVIWHSGMRLNLPCLYWLGMESIQPCNSGSFWKILELFWRKKTTVWHHIGSSHILSHYFQKAPDRFISFPTTFKRCVRNTWEQNSKADLIGPGPCSSGPWLVEIGVGEIWRGAAVCHLIRMNVFNICLYKIFIYI